jgi:hypothetical protein
MPKILDSVASRIYAAGKKRGRKSYSRDSAYAIANAALHKSGHLRKGSLKLTKRGQKWRPKGPRKRR